MSLRAASRASSLFASAARVAGLPTVAVPARSASYFRNDFTAPEHLTGAGAAGTGETDGESGPAGPHVFNNTIDNMPRPQLKGGIVPLDVKYMSTEERVNMLKKRLDHVNMHGEALKATEDRVIGDAASLSARRASLEERRNLIRMDHYRTNLRPQDRFSPIWQDVEHPLHRTPRTPLPSDVGVDVSPTTGMLHLYRMHHAKMFLHQEERRIAIDSVREWAEVKDLDLSFKPEEVPGADVAQMNDVLKYIRHYLAMNPGVSPKERVNMLHTVRALMPHVVKVDKVVEVKRRRRRN